MKSSDEELSASRLHEAVVQYLLAQDRGEEIQFAELLNDFPDVAEELQAYFDAERRVSGETVRKQSATDSRSAESQTTAILPPVERLAPEFADFELINRGGMGIIYKARQVPLDRTVALKFILLGRWASEADHARFRLEAQALGRLQHSAIAQIYSSGEVDGNPYLVMEFIEGHSLRQQIDESPLSADRAAQIMLQIALAVARAHRHHILHRDLKPSNILIDNQQQPHVTDFGLARFLDDHQDLTMTGQIVGTPNYVSPEQARGDSVIGPSSDIYSLGTVLYACLTGRPPFRTDSISQTLLMVQHTDPPRPRLLVPQLPRDLETICLKCLEKNPHQRYASADLLADDLQRFLDRRPIQARPISRFERTLRWTRRNLMQATAVVLALLLICFTAIGLGVHLSVVNRLNNDLSKQNLQLQQSLITSDQLRKQEQETRLATQRLSYAADNRDSDVRVPLRYCGKSNGLPMGRGNECARRRLVCEFLIWLQLGVSRCL